MILGTREAYLNYIPFSFVSLEEQPYRFRLSDAESLATLQTSLMRSGQSHPVTLLETAHEKFLLLDGHRRCDAIRLIRENGGAWDKVLAHVVPYERYSLNERFRFLREKNLLGESPYGLTERGQFFRDFVALGMSVQEMAQECGLPANTIEDTIDLSQARPELVTLLNKFPIEPIFALMLHRRFTGWMQSPHAAQAEATAKKILSHVMKEKITMKSWRFLLDFYWDGDHPFLTNPA